MPGIDQLRTMVLPVRISLAKDIVHEENPLAWRRSGHFRCFLCGKQLRDTLIQNLCAHSDASGLHHSFLALVIQRNLVRPLGRVVNQLHAEADGLSLSAKTLNSHSALLAEGAGQPSRFARRNRIFARRNVQHDPRNAESAQQAKELAKSSPFMPRISVLRICVTMSYRYVRD